jgi:hypothetical protein
MDFSFNLPVLSFPYSICKWKATNENNQLQCFCCQPLSRTSTGVDICNCSNCGFSVSLKGLTAAGKNGSFIKWPHVQLPVCNSCKKTGIRVYGQKTRALTFICSCSNRNYFKTNDGNAACWDGFIDVKKANNIPLETVAQKQGEPITPAITALPENMF